MCSSTLILSEGEGHTCSHDSLGHEPTTTLLTRVIERVAYTNCNQPDVFLKHTARILS